MAFLQPSRQRILIVMPNMATDPQLEASVDCEASIEFPGEGVTTSATVTKVGAALYRVDSVPVMIKSVKFRDVIEADEVEGKALRFRRVVEKSDWRVFGFLLAREVGESEKISTVLRRVEEVGGHWERLFGGCLFICLPPDVGWNPTADVVG
jgi:hypothetical protein